MGGLVGLGPPEAPLLDLGVAASSLCPHTVFPQFVCVLISSFKDTSHNG